MTAKTDMQRALARVERITGKRYARLAAAIDGAADAAISRDLVAEFQRLAADVEQEVAMAKRQGNRDAWQRGRIY
jgi:hypothetical protein